MLGLFLMVFVLGSIYFAHALGHLVAAQLLGFAVPVFGIGLPFGPHLKLGKVNDTEFRIHAMCFGGYVQIPEMGHDEGSTAESNADRSSAPLWKKVIVSLSGIPSLLVCGFVCLLLGTTIAGEQLQEVVVVGLSPTNPIAARAGVQVGDRILGIDHTLVHSTFDFTEYAKSRKSQTVLLHIARAGASADIPLTTNEEGKMGMTLESTASVFSDAKPNLLQSQQLATKEILKFGSTTPEAFSNWLNRRASLQEGSVPGFSILTCVLIGNRLFEMDPRTLPRLAGLLCVDFAIFTMLPWPGLDGGHLLRTLYLGLGGKPLRGWPGRICQWISKLLLVLAIFNLPICPIIHGRDKTR